MQDPLVLETSANTLYEESKPGKLTVWLNLPTPAFWTNRWSG